MKETTPAAMPPCFDRWCKRFDDVWTHQAQKREFRNYIGGLLEESERKNLYQMASNALRIDLPPITSFECAAAWDAVEELQAEAAHQQAEHSSKTEFAEYCEEFPDAPEARLY